MKIRIYLICILFLLIIIPISFSCKWDGITEEYEGDDCTYDSSSPESFDWQGGDFSTVDDPSAVAQNIGEIPASRRNELTADQLSQTNPQDMGDLGDYDGNALTSALQSQGYDTSSLEGDLSGVEFEGETLVFPDGSSVKAKGTGSSQSIEVANDGSIKSFSNTAGVSFFNAQGVSYTGAELFIQSADSVTWEGATSNIVYNFAGQSGTFSVESADRVIVETMTFDKIVDSVFTVTNGELISAGIECDKNNSETKFPNFIPGNPSFVTSECDKEERYFVSYRETPNEIMFSLSENTSLFFKGINANITFNSTSDNASLIIKPNGVFGVRDGILSYIAKTFTEQLEGNCLNYSIADIDFSRGFLKTVLLPFKDSGLACSSAPAQGTTGFTQKKRIPTQYTT